ncbi:hypothetical protein MASR2M36_26600 [Providencia sp.]
MKKGLIAGLLTLTCFNGYSSAAFEGGRVYGEWSSGYAAKIDFNVCKITIDSIYSVISLTNQVETNLDLPKSYSLIAWLPERVFRADCNGHGENIMILTADYVNNS